MSPLARSTSSPLAKSVAVMCSGIGACSTRRLPNTLRSASTIGCSARNPNRARSKPNRRGASTDSRARVLRREVSSRVHSRCVASAASAAV